MTAYSPSVLKGSFLEFCDCFTICPCWVNETPDEDHCSALYVWRFDEESRLDGYSLADKSIAAASYHARQRGTQSAFFVDDTLDIIVQQRLLDLFINASSGDAEPNDLFNRSGLDGLQRLMGSVVQTGTAHFDWLPPGSRPPGSSRSSDRHSVSLTIEGTLLASAEYRDAYMNRNRAGEPRSKPLRLKDTALHDELALVGKVVVQDVGRFELAVAALPGPGFVYSGRAGMSSRFDYTRPQH